MHRWNIHHIAICYLYSRCTILMCRWRPALAHCVPFASVTELRAGHRIPREHSLSTHCVYNSLCFDFLFCCCCHCCCGRSVCVREWVCAYLVSILSHPIGLRSDKCDDAFWCRFADSLMLVCVSWCCVCINCVLCILLRTFERTNRRDGMENMLDPFGFYRRQLFFIFSFVALVCCWIVFAAAAAAAAAVATDVACSCWIFAFFGSSLFMVHIIRRLLLFILLRLFFCCCRWANYVLFIRFDVQIASAIFSLLRAAHGSRRRCDDTQQW